MSNDRYQVIRDALPILIAEAQAKGGRNERAALIVELLEERDALQAEIERLRARVASMSQPAAGEETMVNTPYDVFTLPLQPSGLTSGPRFVVHVPGPDAQVMPDWDAAPPGATHYQPHQDAYYKRVSASEWYVWSRKNDREPMQWHPSLGTGDNAEWVVRPAEQPAEQQPDVSALVELLEAALMVMTSKEVRLEKQADAITMARAAAPQSQLPQDVEEFIAEHAREVSFGRDSVMRDVRGNAVSVYDLRAWMAGHVRVPVELLEQILADVRDKLQQAKNEAYPVCCGRPGSECCGDPEPEWPVHAMKIMDTLGPVERNLSALLSAAKGEGK